MIRSENLILKLLTCAWLYTGLLGCTVMFTNGNSHLYEDHSFPDDIEVNVDLEFLNISRDGCQEP